MRALLFTAWVLPAVMALALRASLPRVQWTAATLLGAALAIGWASLPLWQRWRRFVLATMAGLSARIGFVLPMVVAGTGTLIATTTVRPSTAVVAVPAALWPLALAGMMRVVRVDRARAIGSLLILAFNVATLVGLDWGIRTYVLPHRSHNALFVDHDPRLGWKLRPGTSRLRVTDTFVSHETINRWGFRSIDPPLQKAPGVRRVVVLGDSHSEGYTVDDDATWTSQLGARLAPVLPTEIINLGVGGYATDQELLSYLEYGRRYGPDLVILQFCSNDVGDNGSDSYWRGMKPYFERIGDKLVLRGSPVPDRMHSGLLPPALLERSGIAELADIALSGIRSHHRASYGVDRQEAWRVTALLLRDLRDAVRADGADLMVLMADPGAHRIEERLRGTLSALGVTYVDITPIYAQGADAVRVPHNSHWNAAGHRAVADLVAPVVARALDPGAPLPMAGRP